VKAARELRDRWLEKVNEDPSLLSWQGKYIADKNVCPTPMQLPVAA
jgi:hypothetical protein